jgi:hypothetical protein
MKCIPNSVDTLLLEARGSPLTPIFDEDDYGCEIAPDEVRKVTKLSIATSHYKLISWFLQRVQPKEHLVIDVSALDLWAAEKYIRAHKIKGDRLDIITEKMNADDFQCFLRIDNFREKYISDRHLLEPFVNHPDISLQK